MISRRNFSRVAVCWLIGFFLIWPATGFSQTEKAPAGTVKSTGPVTLDSGRISGLIVGANPEIYVYKGIPYAAPPVGALRWKPPQPAKPWKGVRAGDTFGPVSPQPDILARVYGTRFDKVSEDCLYLNIWTPTQDRDATLPVMFWIHGGGNISGAASTPSYDGENLARQGVVLVSINYRLGPFGFLAHPLLSKESPHGVSGNYGLLDQIAALKWVQKNIRAFGGDPNRVTIFGESAGGLDVCCLMSSPLTKGLFQRAIAESGHAFGKVRHLKETWYGQESLEKEGERIVRELGVADASDPLAALRALPTNKILEEAKPSLGIGGEKGNRFGPGVDGWVLPDDINVVFERGKQNDVPLIAGANANEGLIFTLNPAIKTVEEYKLAVKALYKGFSADVLAMYPVKEPGDIRKALSDTIGDLGFIAGAHHFVKEMATVKSKAFLYYFSMKPQGPLERLGAFHGSEIPYVFDNLEKGRVAPDEEHLKLAKIMSAYWVQFAKTGDPNREGLPKWPGFGAKTNQYLELGKKVTTKRDLRQEACDLFEKMLSEQMKNR
jgi:para-nitrobenzyl esterase